MFRTGGINCDGNDRASRARLDISFSILTYLPSILIRAALENVS